MTNKHKVVLVPTKNESNIAFYQEGTSYNKPVLQIVKYTSSDYTYQHIHILSDEDIKEGDWYICWLTVNGIPTDYELYQATIKDSVDLFSSANNYKKIIATTDSSLKIEGECKIRSGKRIERFPTESMLPQIPSSYIQYYIEQYNKGNVIEEVVVEHEYNTDSEAYNDLLKDDYYKKFPEELPNCIIVNKPKVNSDNTINIVIPSVSESTKSFEEKWIERSKILHENRAIELNNDDNFDTSSIDAEIVTISAMLTDFRNSQKTSCNTYSEDEVINLFEKLSYEMAQRIIGNRKSEYPEPIVPHEWIEKNLKQQTK